MTFCDLHWHWRALRSGPLWSRTRIAIADWLETAPPGYNHLLIFGPSAGWMMSDRFLSRFSRIDAVDQEWAASLLFRLNHASVPGWQNIKLHFHWAEAIANLDHYLSRYPDALVLFDNFLGLYSATCRDVTLAETTLTHLKLRLAGRTWGSLHDLLSGPGFRAEPGQEPATIQHINTHGLPSSALTQLVRGHGDWIDHLTTQLLPLNTNTRLIPWQITPGRWHWLQAGWVNSNPPA